MRCANCGAQVGEDTVFCPSCGHRLQTVRRPEQSAEESSGAVYSEPITYQDTPEDESEPEKARRGSGCRWVMLTGLFTLIFLVVILGLGALGVYHGLQDQNREKVRLAQEHYDKALNYIDEGSYGLAIAELEEAIRLNPEFDEAKLKLNEVRVLAEAKPTSTIDAYRDLAARLYQEARNFYDQGAWEQAIGKLEELRTLDAGLNREDAEAMLFDAYYNRGLALVEEGRMAEAVRLFDKALELRPENPDVLGQRNLASLYAAGLGYWQADWPQAIAKFEALYELEPEYRDVRQRLHDAHLYYGDLLAEQGEWCSAQAQYDRALAIIPTEAIAQRRDQAGQACEQGAPPPEAMPGTPPAEATPAEPGTFVGRFIGYQDISDITNKWAPIRGQLIDVNGEGVPGKAVKIQAFDWSATATTDGNGEFGFEFLDKELTFTLTLIDLPHEPVKVATKIGQRAQVEFVEQP